MRSGGCGITRLRRGVESHTHHCIALAQSRVTLCAALPQKVAPRILCDTVRPSLLRNTVSPNLQPSIGTPRATWGDTTIGLSIEVYQTDNRLTSWPILYSTPSPNKKEEQKHDFGIRDRRHWIRIEISSRFPVSRPRDLRSGAISACCCKVPENQNRKL